MVRADKIKTLQPQLDEKHSAGSLPHQWSAKQPPGGEEDNLSVLYAGNEDNCTHTHRHVYTQLNKNVRKAPEDIIIKCQVLET